MFSVLHYTKYFSNVGKGGQSRTGGQDGQNSLYRGGQTAEQTNRGQQP